MRSSLFLALLFLLASMAPATAGELFGLGGMMRSLNSDQDGSSYSWQLEYREELGKYLAASLSYLNEGHIPAHHRDGNALQLWLKSDLLDRRLSLSGGVGPYFYFDTTTPSAGGSYTNDHDLGAVFSLAAIWKTESPWTFQLRTNWVKTVDSIDTVSALAGIGYQLEPSNRQSKAYDSPAGPWEKATNNEITLFVGRTITNSFDSEQSTSLGIEYRRKLMQNLDWTLSWLYEGDTRLIRRDGLTSQLWAVQTFQDDRITLGFGAGAYFALDNQAGRDQDDDETVSAIATLTGSCRLDPHWSLRTSWNRIITNYDRDTDVIMGGIGYRF